VLGDWKEKAPQASSAPALDESETQALIGKLQRFMSNLSDKDKDKNTNKPTRCANMYHCQALEASLHAIAGLELSRFMPRRRAERLQSTQRRYFVSEGSLGVALRPGSTADSRRSCIEDRATGQRWIEVPLDVDSTGCVVYPCLFSCIDQGSVGWPTHTWLYWGQGLRGDVIFDASHRAMRDTGDALTSTGCWFISS
ncbi:unnamed protein product, partial [Prorocentrum cordatum]